MFEEVKLSLFELPVVVAETVVARQHSRGCGADLFRPLRRPPQRAGYRGKVGKSRALYEFLRLLNRDRRSELSQISHVPIDFQ